MLGVFPTFAPAPNIRNPQYVSFLTHESWGKSKDPFWTSLLQLRQSSTGCGFIGLALWRSQPVRCVQDRTIIGFGRYLSVLKRVYKR